MIIRLIKSFYSCSKAAVGATIQAIKEKITDRFTAIGVGTGIAVHVATGVTTVPIALASIAVTPILFKARQYYIDRLGAEKIKHLSLEEKKAIEDKLAKIDENERLENEAAQDFCNKYLYTEYEPELKKTIFPKAYFFRISRDNKNYYILGTDHELPLSALPPFAKEKIHELLQNPNAFVVTETIYRAYHKSSKSIKDKMMSVISFAVDKMRLIFTVTSFKDCLQGIFCPWYLRSEIDPKLAFIILSERKNFLAGGQQAVVTAFLTDFMRPGAFLSLYLFLRTSNRINPGLYFRQTGMDSIIGTLRTDTYKHKLEELEDPLNVSISMGLKKAAQLQTKDVWEMVQLLLDKPRKGLFAPDKPSGYKRNKDILSKMLKQYGEASLQAGQEDSSEIDKKDKKDAAEEDTLSTKLVQHGIVMSLEDCRIARNLSWFPKILTLFATHAEGLIFVGRAHLGDKTGTGLLNLFTQQGFTVERMQEKSQYAEEPSLVPWAKQTVKLSLERYSPLMSEASLLYYYQAQNARKAKCCASKTVVTELNITSNSNIKLA